MLVRSLLLVACGVGLHWSFERVVAHLSAAGSRLYAGNIATFVSALAALALLYVFCILMPLERVAGASRDSLSISLYSSLLLCLTRAFLLV